MSRWLPEKLTLLRAESYSKAVGKAEEKTDSFDLSTPDGEIAQQTREGKKLTATVVFQSLSPRFVAFHRPEAPCTFVLKSSLTQLGIDVESSSVTVNPHNRKAEVVVTLIAVGPLAVLTLDEIGIGSRIGKLFCADPRRLIVSMDYVTRLDGTFDFRGNPLLKYGGPEAWELKLINGRIIAYLPIQKGVVQYSTSVHGLLGTVGIALKEGTNYKRLLKLHQSLDSNRSRLAIPDSPLIVRSFPLQLRTMFARVVEELLPSGLRSMSSNILEPDDESEFSGRTFVFRGSSTEELTHIPLEFFSLEAYREHLPFELRKSLSHRCSDPETICKAFATAPEGNACTYVCKGGMFGELSSVDWLTGNPVKDPYVEGGPEQRTKAENYLYQQAEYGLLSAIACGDITSDGVMLTRYFPSPVLKSLLLSRQVCKRLRAIYFLEASRSYGSFFSQEDRSLLNDLTTFGINVFQVELANKKMCQFTKRPGWDSGLMVPLHRRDEYLNATVFGVYGSNLVAGSFDVELDVLLKGIKALRSEVQHPKLNASTPLALVTGGGPGAMEVGNRVAAQNGFLSCGMFVDFGSLSRKPGSNINEQKKNPYVEAYMTYRPTKLVERQSEFNLDFPIFLTGGVGTDFEYALEEVRRKVGTVEIHPMILFGDVSHWGNKITGRFQENFRSGTIKGSEWLSNVSYVVSTGEQALAVYRKFFKGKLAIGGKAPANDIGFVVVDDAFVAASKAE
jgi:predicted Rossmann-fold nucleotide-binding protein